jgi:hypothetical protein
VPPFLIFTKGGARRDVVFRGLAVPGAYGLTTTDDLVVIWKSRQDESVMGARRAAGRTPEGIVIRPSQALRKKRRVGMVRS